MCGILALWGTREVPPPTRLRSALETIRHRGPDDEGYILAGARSGKVTAFGGNDTTPELRLAHIDSADVTGFDVALGFRRLSILDLSPKGHQPMGTADGRLWIVFNGEIYNYVELRRELAERGREFRSGGDTEVLLAAYEEWGEGCLDRLRGMWSFAIWDSVRRRLFAARDRFGIKPLFVYSTPLCLMLSSEIKPILAVHREVGPRPGALEEFLTRGAPLDGGREASYFEKVASVPAGHYLRAEGPDVVRQERYYELTWNGREALREQEAVFELRRRLRETVRLHLRADVPVGVCLSGGVDSTTLAALVTKVRGDAEASESFTTFSAVYRESGRFNESERIESFSRESGLQNERVEPDAERLSDELDRLVWHQEEPFQSPSIFAQWCVMALARRSGVKVVLDGQGADEVLGGYGPWLQHFTDHFRRNDWSELGASCMGVVQREGWNGLRAAGAFAQRVCSGRLEQEADAEDRSLRDLIERGTLPRLLRYEDRNSMAFGLESRVPFLDHTFVEFVFRMAYPYRLRKGWRKWILRKAMDGLVPRRILWEGRKVGFDVPETSWMKSRALAVDGRLLSEVLGRKVTIPLQQEIDSDGSARMRWRHLCADRWLRVFLHDGRAGRGISDETSWASAGMMGPGGGRQ